MKNIGAKIGVTLFFFIFFAMGSLFVFFIGREFVKGAKTYTWKKVECSVLSSKVETHDRNDDPYQFNIEYRYRFNENDYVSSSYMTSQSKYSDYSKASILANRYAQGTNHPCFVNPQNPNEAVLKKGNLWIGLVVLFPLLFVTIGLGGIYGTWFGKEVTSKSLSAERSISSKSKSNAKAAVFFFGIFFVVGFAFFFFVFIRPVYKVINAKFWMEVPCRVLSSEVRSHSDSDGTTYREDILYSYEINGRKYQSNKYNFLGGASSGYKGKRKIIEKYPQGSTRLCYVNPKNSFEAVLNRGFTKRLFLLGGFSLVFVFIGLFGIIGTLKKPQDSFTMNRGRMPPSFANNDFSFNFSPSDGTLVLKPKTGPIGKFIGILTFAVLWNGFLVFAASMELGRMPTGIEDMVSFLNKVPFLWIFQIIGFLTFVGVLYQFLALFNPQPRITLSSDRIRLGESVDLHWILKGDANRIKDFSIVLEGKEETTYRRGTTTYTDRNTFYTVDVIRSQNTMQIISGHCSLHIPADKMHTFKSTNNKILWVIVVQGVIDKWPDVKEEFEIPVMPFI